MQACGLAPLDIVSARKCLSPPGGARPAAHSTICPFAGRTPQKASARPGSVRAPPGGLGHFLALVMCPGARPHARMAVYGRRWPTYAISARSRFS
eukprot:scaffold20436_cov66-Phaeocystis_antarctica.AAC.1